MIIFHFNNKYDFFNNSDALLLFTEWEEYKKINWDLAFQKLSKPAGYMIQDQFLILKKSIMQELIFENLVMV